MKFDKNLIKIFTLDIEVTPEKGLPDVENLLKRFYVLLSKINQIRISSLGELNILYKASRCNYIECQSEKQLLMEF